MSLVPTFVKGSDGKYYKNPLLQDETNQWFICYDDDDPIEIVMYTTDFTEGLKLRAIVLAKLAAAGYLLKPCSDRLHQGYRTAFKDGKSKVHRLINSLSCFLKFVAGPAPIEFIKKYDSVVDATEQDRPDYKGDCTFYRAIHS